MIRHLEKNQPSFSAESLICLAIILLVPAMRAGTVDWSGGVGDWQDVAKWGGTLPSRMVEGRINGTQTKPGKVTLARGDVLLSHLSIAEASSNLASLMVDGPSLTVSGVLDVGKYNGSDGSFLLKTGNVFAATIFVSGGGGPGMRGRGSVEIQGGRLVTKDIELGASAGSHTTLRIVGSRASGILAEDGLHSGVYNYLELEKPPPPSATEVIFELDADGVTPMFTWGKTEGRVYFPVPDDKGNGIGTCTLKIRLLAPPPSGDILLIGSANRCKGSFTGLPEGATVRAELGGRSYEWRLTYRGGQKGCDIMLTSPRSGTNGGEMVPYISGKKAKDFRFEYAMVESAYRYFFRHADAQDPPVGGKTPAFPGAEGYGAYSKGGRGGKVLFVTNLLDSGPGSLREAVEEKGPRTVIFRVGGVIETKGLVIREPFITIAGQTAPGDGVCISKTDGNSETFGLSGTHDVVIRFLRFRAGNNTGEFRNESFRAYDSENFIIDHCSCSWGNPETLSASGTVDRYTVQWCICSEGNNEQKHAFATILGGNRSTWHHNLFAHMFSRVPRWGDITVQCDFRNNVIYDWGHTCGYGDLRTLNYVNNYARKGPSTTQKPPYFIIDPKLILPGSIYIAGNIMDGVEDISRDNWKGLRAERILQSPAPFPAPPVETQSAQAAFELVLNQAGATLPRRDPVDARVISQVRNRNGRIINNEKEVGGRPAYASDSGPASGGEDGTPEEWKRAHGLPLNDPGAVNAVNAEGYTQLEVYLNSLVKP